MNKLFSEFTPVDYDTWLAQIKKDLKDKPLDALLSKPEMDLDINAFYHPQKNAFSGSAETAANQFHRHTNEWKIRKAYSTGENKKILSELEKGVDGISLAVTNQQQFETDTNGILFEHISSDLRFDSAEMAKTFAGHRDSALNFDVIGRNAADGCPLFTSEDFYAFYKAQHNDKTIWVTGSLYGEAGSTTAQELAFTIAHLNEYLQLLVDKGESISMVSRKIVIELSVNDNYFVNIAKMRAIRELVASVLSAYDSSFEFPAIELVAKTSPRYLAVNDQNNNLLRATTQAMSAITGGCDVLTISLPVTGDKNQDELNERMAVNIQLVLREESYFDKVVDASAGSYYIESLTDQLITKAWNLFLEVESKGGLQKCIYSNFVQEEIEKNQQYLVEQLNSGQQTFLGINKFQSKLEKWTPVSAANAPVSKMFKALTPFRLESFYVQKPVTA